MRLGAALLAGVLPPAHDVSGPMASSQGSARVAPRPFKAVRRESWSWLIIRWHQSAGNFDVRQVEIFKEMWLAWVRARCGVTSLRCLLFIEVFATTQTERIAFYDAAHQPREFEVLPGEFGADLADGTVVVIFQSAAQ